MVDVATIAKIDLEQGQTLDGLGGYCTYGVCETADITINDNLLPIGIAEGAVLRNPITKDQPITYADVDLPNTVACSLRQEQDETFFPTQHANRAG